MKKRLIIGTLLAVFLAGCSQNYQAQPVNKLVENNNPPTPPTPPRPPGPTPTPQPGPTPNPHEGEFKIKVKNTKACYYGNGDQTSGDGAFPAPNVDTVYKDNKAVGNKLYWRITSRKNKKDFQCGEFLQDVTDRWRDIEQSFFYIFLKNKLKLDPIEYYIDIVLSSGNKICNSMDTVVGSSKTLKPLNLPRSARGLSAESDENPGFVVTTRLGLFTNGAPECEQTGEGRPIDCQCDELEEPLMIDLGGEGLQLTSAENGVLFDIANRGKKQKVAWPTEHSRVAFLAFDRNNNGKIDNGSELAGTATLTPDNSVAANGFEALLSLDANNDLTFDRKDPLFSKALLWVDENHNGLSEPGELSKLSEKIRAINLNYSVVEKGDPYGSKVFAESSATTVRGEKVYAADVWLRVED